MIYFDSKKNAYSFAIADYVADIDDETWEKHCHREAGTTWDIVDGAFIELEDPAFFEAKQAKLRDNKTAYGLKIKSGVNYLGNLFDCDDTATIRITGKTLKLQSNEDVLWFDYDCRPVALSHDEFLGLGNLVEQHITHIETYNCTVVAQINAAQTIDEIESIIIDYSEV